jgi:hypothetical protein
MELSGELAKQSLGLFETAKRKQEEGWQALKSLRLGTFLRLAREGGASQAEAFRLLRRSGELLQGAETTLGIAAALMAEVEKESEQ